MPERQSAPDEVGASEVSPDEATGTRREPNGAAALPDRPAEDSKPAAAPSPPVEQGASTAAEETVRVESAQPTGANAPTEVMIAPRGPGVGSGIGSGIGTDTPPPDDSATTVIASTVTEEAREPRRNRRRRVLLVAGVIVGLLAVLYVVDLVRTSGTLPRGTTIAGQPVGELTPAEAEQRVRATIEPRTVQPVAVAVGPVRSEVDPRAAGLAVDWAGTIEQAGTQPLNPISRIRSLFTSRETGVASTVDNAALDSALQQLVPIVNRPPTEGTVRFEGATPLPVPPVDGQELNLPAAETVLVRDWTSGTVVNLPVTVLEPITTEDDVAEALAAVATPAVSAPVEIVGENVTGTLTPEVIASALSFRADAGRGLVPEVNRQAIEEAVDPQMASSEQPGRDASLSFSTGQPVITPSQDGRGIDWDATLFDLLTVLTTTDGDRRITAVYAAQPADLTTEELEGLGITGVIGEFTTSGFARDSGLNIRRAAQVINGTIVEPGETFSLNGATAPRNASNGYVEAGIISDGHPSRGVGGGVSQVATTLYNAAYYAGMTDVEHQPHSFYISRYPPGREATVVSGPLDLKWRNDTPGGVVVQTIWTPSTLTVRIWGTKRYAVTSTPGPRTNPTQPTKIELPPGEPCTPSQGAPGFTITDTRTLRDLKTRAVRTERRTTKYNPSPIVSCSSG